MLIISDKSSSDLLQIATTSFSAIFLNFYFSLAFEIVVKQYRISALDAALTSFDVKLLMVAACSPYLTLASSLTFLMLPIKTQSDSGNL